MENTNEEVLQPFALLSIHEIFDLYINKLALPKDSALLDYGAGSGAFLQRLQSQGYTNLSACELNVDNFKLKGVKCLPVDVNTCKTAYDDKQFDLIISTEVFEHLYNFHSFLDECKRLLKDGGLLTITTPNIMSIKSRLTFLFKGLFYSFERAYKDKPGHHINAVRIDLLEFFAHVHGFEIINVETDKAQSTSKFFYYLLYPFIKKQKSMTDPNNKKLLLGRTLFITFRKQG